MINYSIEKLSVDDYDKSNNVWDMKKCPFTEAFKKQVARNNREPYIMKYKDKYVATCDLVYDYEDYTEENVKVYLSRLIVKKEYRNQGFGQEFLKYIVALCKEKGYQQITLGVDTDNKNALRIYQKFGFTVYQTANDMYGEYYKMIAEI